MRNAWYVAAWGHELPKGTLLARTLLCEPLVLWRTADGSVAALEDRCVHRHAPLSRGRLEGDALRCGYHGLKFAPDGRCIEVPAMASVPPAACVRRYAVPGVPPPAHYRPLWPHEGAIDRWLDYEFILPGTLLMHSGAQPAGMSADEARERGTGVRCHSCQALTPETTSSTHYFFMEAHPAGQGDASVTDALHRGIMAAFEEDRATIAAQWANIQRAPDRPMLPLAMDAALVHYRRVYAQALQAEQLSTPP